MTLDELVGYAEAMALPVVHLVAKPGSGPPIASWSDGAAFSGGTPVLQVHLGNHPSPLVRSDTTLSFFLRFAYEEVGRASVAAGHHVDLAGRIPLWPEATTEWPGLTFLLQKGPPVIGEWLRSTGFGTQREVRRPAPLRDYESRWMRRSPMKTQAAFAQLGGWQMGYDLMESMDARELVLKTYREAEPWVEVLRHRESGALDVVSRVT
jgi:hypothetical protein